MIKLPRIVVLGGGIAGSTVLNTLIADNTNDISFSSITLISGSRLIKQVTNFSVSGRNLETFDVIETTYDNLIDTPQRGLESRFIEGQVDSINVSEKKVFVSTTRNDINKYQSIDYDILCICLGSHPKELDISSEHIEEVERRIFTIRDTTSVEELQRNLSSCKRVAIIGNGGISLEVIHNLTDCDKIWLVRDDSIGVPFFDSGVSKFLLNDSIEKHSSASAPKNNTSYSSTERQLSGKYGPALGPDWSRGLKLKGQIKLQDSVQVLFNKEVESIAYTPKEEYPLNLKLNDGQSCKCDLVIVAIGVQPNQVKFIGASVDISARDGGILVDEKMQSSIEGIYAAGDIISCEKWSSTGLWFQMRLWTQARQMGYYCAKSIMSHIKNEDSRLYFNFECFTHCTTFFNHKLILIGLYNAQGLDESAREKCEILVRVNPGKEYTKLLVKDNKIIGALLLGETGLEETIENLIHDQLDIESVKDQLLDGRVDIEDYYD